MPSRRTISLDRAAGMSQTMLARECREYPEYCLLIDTMHRTNQQ